MRILMHCIYFPPEVGGLESHVFHLCRSLAARGHEVTIVTSRSRPGLPGDEIMDGVRVRRTWLPGRTPPGWAAHAAGSLPATLRAGRDADLLHAQAFASIPPLLPVRALRGTPLVATLHTSHFLIRARRPAWRPILRELVRAPDRVLAASAEIRDVAMELSPGTRVEALVNGVDTTLFRPLDRRPSAADPSSPAGAGRIVVPRRLFPKNGVDVFVEAFPRIVTGRPGVQAFIVGDGPERSRLEARARSLGVGEALHFLGARPNREMPELLASMDLAVIPSRMEATSVAALESMACGLPVVASEVGGLPEIVDGRVGALVPPEDPSALADAVLSVLADPDRSHRGAAARERVVGHWSNERLVDRHLEIYEDVLDRSRRGHRG